MPHEAENFAPVSAVESGQKLLRFLVRRLGMPEALLHRWLRTGQIRLNGKRAKPFEVVNAGDLIRLPPFALKLARISSNPDNSCADLPPMLANYLLAQDNGLWVFNKPVGLAVQGGTGQTDSIASRLASACAGRLFVPAPAHRLDKDTSGILLVGATFPVLQQLQGWFREGKIHKEYLAWARGDWPFAERRILRHYLSSGDKVIATEEYRPGSSEGISHVQPLLRTDGLTLLQILLVTGCKRQIRAQLSAMGFAIQGDSRYGAKHGARLKLHALRTVLPDGREFACLPQWGGKFAVTALPPIMTD